MTIPRIFKNKTLYSLIMEKRWYFFLMEWEIIRGIITDFSRYDIALGLKGGFFKLTVLRVICDCRAFYRGFNPEDRGGRTKRCSGYRCTVWFSVLTIWLFRQPSDPGYNKPDSS